MIAEFKAFLTKSNALALAIGVIIGAASAKVVTAIVNDLFMPIIGLVMPQGEWTSARLELGSTGKAIMYGDLLSNIIDFVVIAFVVFMVTKALIRDTPEPPSQVCPFCKEKNAIDASRCKACTSALTTEAVVSDQAATVKAG